MERNRNKRNGNQSRTPCAQIIKIIGISNNTAASRDRRAVFSESRWHVCLSGQSSARFACLATARIAVRRGATFSLSNVSGARRVLRREKICIIGARRATPATARVVVRETLRSGIVAATVNELRGSGSPDTKAHRVLRNRQGSDGRAAPRIADRVSFVARSQGSFFTCLLEYELPIGERRSSIDGLPGRTE